MTTMTSQEQLWLEMTNRARLDPAAEAARLGISLNQFLPAGADGSPITGDARQPLAGSDTLARVAENHAAAVFNKMVANGALNFDGHNGAGDGTPTQRINDSGYGQNPLGNGEFLRPENFGWANTTAALTQAQLQSMVESNHNGLFIDDPANTWGSPAGHRLAMLATNVKEVGVGMVTGSFQGLNNLISIENFGASGTRSFLTGSVYNDTVIRDDFYSLGEAVAGVTATVTNSARAVVGSDTTGSGGGWSVGEPGGTHTVTFSGGGLARSVSATIEAGSLNAKVDLVNGTRIDASASATLGTGAQDLRLIGMTNVNGTGNAAANTITGNKGANVLDGKGGNDTLDGAAGDDTAVLSGNKADYQVTVLSSTSAKFADLRGGAPDGTDTILNIEHVKFADQTVDFGNLRTTTAPTPTPTPVSGSVKINDVTISEGNSGTKVATFTVSRTGGSAAFDVNVATANGSATTADNDYLAKSDTLHFAAGINSQTFSVTIKGDTKVEANETFKVALSGATNGASLSDALGIGTITNDDVAAANHAPVATAHDVSVAARSAVTGASMFRATDQDGNATITKFAFWDTGSAGGHFTVNGVAQDAGKWIVLDRADIGSVKYVGAATSGASEKVYVTAYDGKAWAPNATLTASTVARPTEDFNGDAKSDILWHNDSGKVAMWQMDGAHITMGKVIGTMPSNWHAESTDDFNGDGKSDILWEHTNGSVVLWEMNGSQVTSSTLVTKPVAGWHVAATDDFNGDGKSDILWTSDTGQVSVWLMDGSKVAAHPLVGQIGSGWHVEDAADFSGDGKADILWHNDNGSVAMWQMNGGKIVSNTTVGQINPAWTFSGADDFNGDGKADVLWRKTDGTVAMWQMNGDKIASNATVGAASTKWHIADTGDYNGDGHNDILLQHDNGAVAMWQMDGAHIVANQSVGTITSDWHM